MYGYVLIAYVYVYTHMYTFRAEYRHTHIFIHIYTHNTYILKRCTHTCTHMQSATCAKKIEAHGPQESAQVCTAGWNEPHSTDQEA